MCYARRQRSSWARIKLSVKIVYLSTFVPKHLFQSYFVLASKFYFVWVFKVCLTRFLFAHLVLVQKFHCCSIFNDQMPPWGRPQVDSLPIIHQLPLFVKHFFQKFFRFFAFFFFVHFWWLLLLVFVHFDNRKYHFQSIKSAVADRYCLFFSLYLLTNGLCWCYNTFSTHLRRVLKQ